MKKKVKTPKTTKGTSKKSAVKKGVKKKIVKKKAPEPEPEEEVVIEVGSEVQFEYDDEELQGKVVEISDEGYDVQVGDEDVYTLDIDDLTLIEEEEETTEEEESEDPEEEETPEEEEEPETEEPEEEETEEPEEEEEEEEEGYDGKTSLNLEDDYDENDTGFENIPAGTYDGVLDEVDLGDSQAGNKMLTWQFLTDTDDDATDGKRLYYWTVLNTRKGINQLKQVINRLGPGKINMKKFNPKKHPEKLIGTRCRLKVVMKKNQDGEKQSQIKEILPAKEKGAKFFDDE